MHLIIFYVLYMQIEKKHIFGNQESKNKNGYIKPQNINSPSLSLNNSGTLNNMKNSDMTQLLLSRLLALVRYIKKYNIHKALNMSEVCHDIIKRISNVMKCFLFTHEGNGSILASSSVMQGTGNHGLLCSVPVSTWRLFPGVGMSI